MSMGELISDELWKRCWACYLAGTQRIDHAWRICDSPKAVLSGGICESSTWMEHAEMLSGWDLGILNDKSKILTMLEFRIQAEKHRIWKYQGNNYYIIIQKSQVS